LPIVLRDCEGKNYFINLRSYFPRCGLRWEGILMGNEKLYFPFFSSKMGPVVLKKSNNMGIGQVLDKIKSIKPKTQKWGQRKRLVGYH